MRNSMFGIYQSKGRGFAYVNLQLFFTDHSKAILLSQFFDFTSLVPYVPLGLSWLFVSRLDKAVR